jgi:transmembrane sensor
MDQTIVAVTEGAVDVLPPRPAAAPDKPKAIHLTAGELVSIGPLEPVVAVRQVESKAVNAWQEGRLEFADEPLGMVIDTINRYSHRDVVITDQDINEFRFTGTVSRDRVDEWLFALSEIFPLDVRRVGNDTVLISRRTAGGRQAFRSAPLIR